MRRALLITGLLLTSALLIKSQCIGTGCPGSSGGSTPTTVPTIYKLVSAIPVSSSAQTSTVNITTCASILCDCSFTAFSSTGSGNARFVITYVDALNFATWNSGFLAGNQSFGGNMAVYRHTFNSSSTAPTWSIFNGGTTDTFSVAIICHSIN